jgi:hypothetical protein
MGFFGATEHGNDTRLFVCLFIVCYSVQEVGNMVLREGWMIMRRGGEKENVMGASRCA